MCIFSTLTNYKFLLKTLTLYESICNLTNNFKFYCLCTDDKTIQFFEKNNIPNINILTFDNLKISDKLYQFNKPKELHCSIKPSVTNYILNTIEEQCCLQVDSDIYFYKSPKIFNDITNNYDLALHTHKSDKNNLYNGGLCYFNNTTLSKEACKWYSYVAINKNNKYYGKYGRPKSYDQKYLIGLQKLFPNIKIKNIDKEVGHGAPWNIGFSDIKNNKYRTVNVIDKYLDLNFFHFAQFKEDIKNDNWIFRRKQFMDDNLNTPEKIRLCQNYFNSLRKTYEKYF